jgi:hypothetical protein
MRLPNKNNAMVSAGMESTGPPVLHKTSKRRKWHPWIIIAIIIAIYLSPGLLLTSYLYISDAAKERRSRIPFNSETWKKAEPRGIRLKMVDDLIVSHTLEGRSRDEAIDLLGDPNGDPGVKKRFPDWHLHYYLGPTRRNFLFRLLDYDYLVLRLDKQGEVVAVNIVTFTT